MKSLGSLIFLAALAFYVAWPAYSSYQIKTALDAKDPAALSAKIDFPRLRASLRPAVAVKVEKTLTETVRKAGPVRVPGADDIKAKLMPNIIDGVLAVLVTPETLIRIHAEGTSLKDVIDGIVAERTGEASSLGGLIVAPAAGGSDGAFGTLGKVAEKLGIDPAKALGGLIAKKDGAAPQTAEPAPKSSSTQNFGLGYGLENVKRFGLNGPLGVAVGVARDPHEKEADLTAEMSFIDGDWKLTGLVPTPSL